MSNKWYAIAKKTHTDTANIHSYTHHPFRCLVELSNINSIKEVTALNGEVANEKETGDKYMLRLIWFFLFEMKMG